LRLLAKRLAAASNPVEAARIKERLTRGFYGIYRGRALENLPSGSHGVLN
jgi:hypothetical protein